MEHKNDNEIRWDVEKHADDRKPTRTNIQKERFQKIIYTHFRYMDEYLYLYLYVCLCVWYSQSSKYIRY